MPKKNSNEPVEPIEEVMEEGAEQTSLIQERPSRGTVRASFASAEEQARMQEPDTSQAARPRGGGAMQFNAEQEERLRAVPAAPGQGRGVPAAKSVFLPSAIVEEPNYPRDIDEAVESDEPWVVVKPRSTFSCVIGHHRWYLEKDKAIKVPLSVKEILARGEMIYP